MKANGQLHGLAGLTPGKVTLCPFEWRLCGNQSRSGGVGVETMVHPLLEIETRFFGF
jgi:hypothetical protein